MLLQKLSRDRADLHIYVLVQTPSINTCLESNSFLHYMHCVTMIRSCIFRVLSLSEVGENMLQSTICLPFAQWFELLMPYSIRSFRWIQINIVKRKAVFLLIIERTLAPYSSEACRRENIHFIVFFPYKTV